VKLKLKHKKIELVSYKHDEDLTKKYYYFLMHHYDGDTRINQYIPELKRLLSPDNPFFNFAIIKNFVAIDDNKILGHVSAIKDKRLDKVGIIGFYDCINDIQISNLLLDNAVKYLRDNNCSIIRGPINLSIWHGYRFIENQKRNPTLFDPFNKDYYVKFWQDFGFKIIERYVSAVRSDFNYVLPYTKSQYEINIKEGFKIREFDKNKSEEELKLIYNLSKRIFYDSWNQVDISFQEFYYIYKNILDKIDPYFFEIIETKESEPVGFSFAIPNPFIEEQLILKTMGVLKEYQGKKLASTFMYSQHTKAKEKGYNECYYPLIRIGNNISKFPYQGYEIITNYVSFELIFN